MLGLSPPRCSKLASPLGTRCDVLWEETAKLEKAVRSRGQVLHSSGPGTHRLHNGHLMRSDTSDDHRGSADHGVCVEDWG